MKDSLRAALKKLRLSGLLQTLDVRLHEAATHRLAPDEFLELILQDELLVRNERVIRRRVKAARLRELKTLDDIDWSFNPSIKRKQVYDLATGRFIREAKDVLWMGPPGTGKSMCCQILAYQAIKLGFTALYCSIFDLVRDLTCAEDLGDSDRPLTEYLKTDLLIIDDMGMKHLPARSGECLFEIVMRRHQTRATMMTSNRPLEDWGKLVGDVPSATAILDRFLQHAEIIELTGRSYRLRHQAEAAAAPKPAKVPSGREGSEAESKPAKVPIGLEGLVTDPPSAADERSTDTADGQNAGPGGPENSMPG